MADKKFEHQKAVWNLKAKKVDCSTFFVFFMIHDFAVFPILMVPMMVPMFTMMISAKVLHNFDIVEVVRYLYRINIADESLRLLRYDPIEIESIHISQ